MPDDQDFIEEMQSEARLRFGKELTPAEAASKFAMHNLDLRVYHLKKMAETDSYTSLKDAAKRLTYTRALRDTHERLRKIDR